MNGAHGASGSSLGVQSETVGPVGMGGFCERIVGGREMRRSKTTEVIALVGSE